MFTPLLLAGALSYAQAAASSIVVGYYMQSTTFPVRTLVTNGSLAKLTHLNYAFGAVQVGVRC